MRQSISTRVPSVRALLVAGTATLAGGCTDNNISVYIQQMQAPSYLGAACTVDPTPSGQHLFEGTLDLALRDNYVVSPLFRNSLLARANATEGRAETNAVQIQGFVIEVHRGSPDGDLLARPFSVSQTTYVQPGVGGTPGYAATTVQIIPPAIAVPLRASVCTIEPNTSSADCPVPRYTSHDVRLIVRIQAYGETQGGISVQTPWYDYPVNVCCRCLLQFLPEAESTTVAGPDCLQGMAVLSSATCNLGQDFLTDCRTCSGTSPAICQPRGFRANPAVACTGPFGPP